MTDQTPANALDNWYFEQMGRAALAINSLPRLKKFGIVHGGRRMLGDRTPGAATLTPIQGGKQ
jgi:hypothetical protein